MDPLSYLSDIVDYPFKSSIRAGNSTLAITGRTQRNFPSEIFRSRVIEKFGAFTYYFSP